MSLRVFSPGVEWLLESALWLLQCILVRLFFYSYKAFVSGGSGFPWLFM